MPFFVFIITNFFMWHGKISEMTWLISITTVGLGYPLFNLIGDKIHITESKVEAADLVKEIVKLAPLIKKEIL